EVLEAMGFSLADDVTGAERDLAERGWSMLATKTLSPALDTQLSLRRRLGVRNSAHTLAKLIQPFSGPALRLVNYTHPAYRDTLIKHFVEAAQPAHPGVFLARGTEGEAVADPALARETLWLHEGEAAVVIDAGSRIPAAGLSLPSSASAQATAAWITDVLAGKIPVLAGIAAQVEAIQSVVGAP